MKSVDQIDRLLAAIEAYAIAVIREAINVSIATAPASFRQETIEARVKLIAALGEMDLD